MEKSLINLYSFNNTNKRGENGFIKDFREKNPEF